MNVDPFLALLEGVKQTGRARWIAKCPAHADKRPSLSVDEGANGTILICCRAGCAAIDVVHAVGLELADLFPKRDLSKLTKPQAADVRMIAKRNQVEAAAYACEHESHILMQVATAMLAGNITQADYDRLIVAQERISAARHPIRQRHGTYPVHGR